MDFDLTELQASVQREARAVAAQFDLNYWRDHDRSKAYPWEFVRAFAAAGWLGGPTLGGWTHRRPWPAAVSEPTAPCGPEFWHERPVPAS
jgi:hypothetical protein